MQSNDKAGARRFDYGIDWHYSMGEKEYHDPYGEGTDENAQFDRQDKYYDCCFTCPQVIKSFCNRVKWRDHGRLVADGSPDDIVERYLTDKLNE
jgi:hypothetical protein